MSELDLLSYWPDSRDVVACIKTDAEAASEAVSLAVHQPMRFRQRVIGSKADAAECTEWELLNAFLSQDLPDGRVIIPIVGQSGVGKSHVIRWLDTQLRAAHDRAARVVIRIPKGVSLREVLRILLDELRSDAYEHYREELQRAQHELDATEASGLLCEMLAHTLREMGDAARLRRIERPHDVEAKERDTYCAPEMLPALLRNQYLRDHHFINSNQAADGPVRRLIEHLTTPRDAGTEDDRKHGFVDDDLDFRSIDIERLGTDERKAVVALGRPERRRAAARILNLAIDDAKQRLLRIGPATISDLFDAVRRDLFRDGKELVLLVEDFVVLSGLQKQLLQVMIKEAVRDGRQELCTMRTALAYTTGYLDADTVLTRAHVEYRIPDEVDSEDDTFERIERLVGAYLNAARLGQPTLEHAYKSRAQGGTEPSWIPVFHRALEPEQRATLDDFGRSGDGYELFPLNRRALRQLAREGCVGRGGTLVYNPRFVIQNVLNVVLVHRSLFQNGRFPPHTFGSTGNVVSEQLTRSITRNVPEADVGRYLRFVAYWTENGRVGRRVAEVFQLRSEVLDTASTGHQTREAKGPTPREEVVEPVPVAHVPGVSAALIQTAAGTLGANAPTALEERWNKTLEEWRRGTALGQRDADQLRKLLFEGTRDAIEWDWILFRPRKFKDADREYIYIPRAAGGGGRSPQDSMAVLCTEQDLVSEAGSARIKQALMALIRRHIVYEKSMDYEGAEEDLAAYCALTSRLAPAVRAFLSQRYFGGANAWDPIPLLVQGLVIGARALAIEGAERDDAAALANASLCAWPEGSASGAGAGGWTEYLAALRKCGVDGHEGRAWGSMLLDCVAARQGGADRIHAIDAGALKLPLEETLKDWAHTAPPPRVNVAGVPDLESLKALHSELRRLSGVVEKERDALIAWRTRTDEWLGGELDKTELARLMKEVVIVAQEVSLAPSAEGRALQKTIEDFRVAPVKTALDDISRLSPDTSRGVTLTVLARKYDTVIQLTDRLSNEYAAFETLIGAEISGKEATLGSDPLTDAVDALKRELSDLELALGDVHDGHQ